MSIDKANEGGNGQGLQMLEQNKKLKKIIGQQKDLIGLLLNEKEQINTELRVCQRQLSEERAAHNKLLSFLKERNIVIDIKSPDQTATASELVESPIKTDRPREKGKSEISKEDESLRQYRLESNLMLRYLNKTKEERQRQPKSIGRIMSVNRLKMFKDLKTQEHKDPQKQKSQLLNTSHLNTTQGPRRKNYFQKLSNEEK